jgi:hypothetical protein
VLKNFSLAIFSFRRIKFEIKSEKLFCKILGKNFTNLAEKCENVAKKKKFLPTNIEIFLK